MVQTATGVPAAGTVSFALDGAATGEAAVTDGAASIEIPAGLFRNALQGDPGAVKDPRTGAEVPFPRVSVYVKCETPGQLLGMAEPDLYLLEYEQPFALNYLKGMIGLSGTLSLPFWSVIAVPAMWDAS